MKFIFVEPPESIKKLINLLVSQHTVIVLHNCEYEVKGVDIYPTTWYFNQRKYECDVITFFNKPELYITALEKTIKHKLSVYWNSKGPYLHTLNFPKSCLYMTDVFFFHDTVEQSSFRNILNFPNEKTVVFNEDTIDQYVIESVRLIDFKKRCCSEFDKLHNSQESIELIYNYQTIVPFFSNKIDVANFFLNQGNILFNTKPYEIS